MYAIHWLHFVVTSLRLTQFFFTCIRFFTRITSEWFLYLISIFLFRCLFFPTIIHWSSLIIFKLFISGINYHESHVIEWVSDSESMWFAYILSHARTLSRTHICSQTHMLAHIPLIHTFKAMCRCHHRHRVFNTRTHRLSANGEFSRYFFCNKYL